MGCKGKGKGSWLESRLHDNACSTDFTFPLARWAPMQPATIDPTLDLCTRYPLWLGGPRQCGIRSLPDTSTHGQHWESNPRPSDLESNALSTGPHLSINAEKLTSEFCVNYKIIRYLWESNMSITACAYSKHGRCGVRHSNGHITKFVKLLLCQHTSQTDWRCKRKLWLRLRSIMQINNLWFTYLTLDTGV